MKELRITAIVPMPDDAMEAGEKMAALRPHVKALEEALGVKIETKLVRPVERKSASEKPALLEAAPVEKAAVLEHPRVAKVA